MRQNRMIEGIASTLAGAIAWGMSGTCVQYLFAHSAIDSLLLTALRQVGAGIMFLAVLLLGHRDQLRKMLADADSRRRLAIFGTAGLFLNSTLYATTISYTNAGTATVLQSLNVPMVLGLACPDASNWPPSPVRRWPPSSLPRVATRTRCTCPCWVWCLAWPRQPRPSSTPATRSRCSSAGAVWPPRVWAWPSPV